MSRPGNWMTAASYRMFLSALDSLESTANAMAASADDLAHCLMEADERPVQVIGQWPFGDGLLFSAVDGAVLSVGKPLWILSL